MTLGLTINDLPVLVFYLIGAIFGLIIIISVHDWHKYERKNGHS
ncbi:MAG: hypothetical protein AAB612_00520 [Patescibacteria group bacterium]